MFKLKRIKFIIIIFIFLLLCIQTNALAISDIPDIEEPNISYVKPRISSIIRNISFIIGVILIFIGIIKRLIYAKNKKKNEKEMKHIKLMIIIGGLLFTISVLVEMCGGTVG